MMVKGAEAPIQEVKKMEKEKVSFWDWLAKTPTEKKLLARLRRLEIGKLCEYVCGYNEWSRHEEGDTFASEVVYRVGYEIGHWYQDLDEYEDRYESNNKYERYPDGITPAEIRKAEKWVKDAEDLLGTGRRTYF